MRAAYFSKHGAVGEIQFGELPRPQAGPGEVLLHVKACALNHADLWTLRGIPGVKLQMPHVPGCDVAGTVGAVGQGVTSVKAGDRVVLNPSLWCGECEHCKAGEESMCRSYRLFGEHTRGGLAEFTVVPARNLIPVPLGFPFESAAAAPVVFLTAWRALATKGALKPGMAVLIVGAGGGLATAAIQVAKHLGARVIALTSTPEKEKRVRELGADEAINYRAKPDWDKDVWQLTGKRGVDVVLDSVGRATLAKSVRACARGGKVVVPGGTTGYDATIDLAGIFWRQVSILGTTMANAREAKQVMDLVFQKKLKPVIDRVLPLSQARQAFEILERGEQFGKIVLTV